jgi:hypothetical protein
MVEPIFALPNDSLYHCESVVLISSCFEAESRFTESILVMVGGFGTSLSVSFDAQFQNSIRVPSFDVSQDALP